MGILLGGIKRQAAVIMLYLLLFVVLAETGQSPVLTEQSLVSGPSVVSVVTARTKKRVSISDVAVNNYSWYA